MLVAVLVVVVLALGGTVVALGMRHTSARPYVSTPTVTTLVDVSTLGDDYHLLPLNGPGQVSLTSGTVTVVRLGGSRGQALVGIDSSTQSGYPAWMVPLNLTTDAQASSDPSAPAGCVLSGSALTCADGITRDAGTGRAIPTTTATSTTSTSPVPTQSGDTTGGSPSTPPGSTGTGSSAGTSATTGTDAAQSSAGAPEGGTTVSREVGTKATEDLPFATDGRGIVNASGASVPDVTLTAGRPVWSASTMVDEAFGPITRPDASTMWVMSDGSTVWGIKGSTVAWHLDLGSDGAALNGLGTTSAPHWVVASGTVVLGQTAGIVGLDAKTGEQLWRLDTPLDSWFLSGDDVVIETKGTIALAHFPLGAPVTAESGQSGAFVPPSTVKPPTTDELAQATLEVPEGCAAFAFEGGTDTATFAGGKTTSPMGYGTVSMKATTYSVMGGQPVTVTLLNCFGGGNSSYDVVAVYDADKKLIGSVDQYADQEHPVFQGDTESMQISGVSAVGDTLTVDVPHIGLYGDAGCRACQTSGSATGTFTWDGDRLATTDIVYHTPNGDVRTPSEEAVQRFYDAVATGDDDYADPFMSSGAKESLSRAVDTTGFTYRTAFFVHGGKVSCTLVGPNLFGVNPTEWIAGAGVDFSPDIVKAGDTVCGLFRGTSTSIYLGPDGGHTAEYMILSGTEDGSLRVAAIGAQAG